MQTPGYSTEKEAMDKAREIGAHEGWYVAKVTPIATFQNTTIVRRLA